MQASKAELAIAKQGYVRSRCGWFSDRSACYLASGRPVIAHDTGFPSRLPPGEGLFAFTTIDDIRAAIDAVNADYPRHRCAARDIAAAAFDSRTVLPAKDKSANGTSASVGRAGRIMRSNRRS